MIKAMDIGRLLHFKEKKAKSIEKDNAITASFLEYNPRAKLLDIGCGDGKRTLTWAWHIGTRNITGIDAKDFGQAFNFIAGDLDNGLPFDDMSFDVVLSHHVIEHVKDTDLFASEIYRVLKASGYAVISTPNLASGKVIAELLINRQPLWACVSDQFFVRGFTDELLEKGRGFLHRRLFTLEGLTRLLEYYGFIIEGKRRHGYGVLPFGKILRGLYAANLSVKVRRPE